MAMLACARIGAVHSVVFGGFAAKELATRIDDAKPKVIVSASCGIEVKKVIAYKPLLDKAIDMSDAQTGKCVILQRPMEKASMIDGRDVDWVEAMAAAQPADCVPVAATDPLYILYTSGTTGQPKGVVRDNGGHVVALKWTMKASTTWMPAMSTGPPRMSAGWWATPTSSTAAVQGLHHHPVRGQTGGHAGCRRLLAGDCRAQGQDHVHRAHGFPGHQARGSGRRV
jgi:acyl-coenzyme A synthetase/AMP-(fatty) acid ligase